MKTAIAFCLALCVTLLSGCGEHYCIAGFGQCAEMFAKSDGQSTQPAAQSPSRSDLSLSGPREVYADDSIVLTVEGGRPNYTFSIVKFTLPDRTLLDPPTGPDVGLIQVMSSTPTKARYTPGSKLGWVEIQVKDADNKLSNVLRVKVVAFEPK
ncbi:MAG: hypothetical protein HY537_03685 [Deltaproteobacteria bacterium]|nr:hypothetical protein [Deltaproteobacteria bacterium]